MVYHFVQCFIAHLSHSLDEGGSRNPVMEPCILPYNVRVLFLKKMFRVNTSCRPVTSIATLICQQSIWGLVLGIGYVHRPVHVDLNAAPSYLHCTKIDIYLSLQTT